MNVGAEDEGMDGWVVERVSGWLEEWLWMDGGGECLVEWCKDGKLNG